MSEPIIQVNNLSKHYRLGALGASSLAEELRHLWARMNGRPIVRGIWGQTEEEATASFWALKEMSFNVEAGDVVGVIGKNGAGKSTLLKILSRITEPTSGEVVLGGRVASLLEVGTGFHADFTGRENIYLNGAINGMRRREIARKFDEIVDFAEVGKFIDTPVKRYSSGMYVRLAFAVAAHLEPEILLVDEVLAVGDLTFQQKCLGKMEEVAAREGRTVLFVSHNMGAIGAMTKKALYLDRGRVAFYGNTKEALGKYFNETFDRDAKWKAPGRSKFPLQITALRLFNAAGAPHSDFEASEGFLIELDYEVRQYLRGAVVEIFIFASDGTHVVTLGEHDTNATPLLGREVGRYSAQVRVPPNLLNTGSYFLRIYSGVHSETYDQADTLSFNVVEHKNPVRQGRRGHIVPMLKWNVARTAEVDDGKSAEPARSP